MSFNITPGAFKLIVFSSFTGFAVYWSVRFRIFKLESSTARVGSSWFVNSSSLKFIFVGGDKRCTAHKAQETVVVVVGDDYFDEVNDFTEARLCSSQVEIIEQRSQSSATHRRVAALIVAVAENAIPGATRSQRTRECRQSACAIANVLNSVEQHFDSSSFTIR